MPLLFGRGAQGQATRPCPEVLDRVGLSDRMDHKPTELSGASAARRDRAGLAMDPDIVLADEPTGTWTPTPEATS